MWISSIGVLVFPDGCIEKNSCAMSRTHAISDPDFRIFPTAAEIVVTEGFSIRLKKVMKAGIAP